MRMCHIQIQNDPFVLNNFFGKNHCYYFHIPIDPFHCAKLKKNSYSGSRVMMMRHFGPKMVHLPETNFFWEIIIIILIYLLDPFIVQI